MSKLLGHVESIGEDIATKRAYQGQPTGHHSVNRP